MPLHPLDPRTTALLLIDLQKSVLSLNTQPRPTSQFVVNTKRLVEALGA